MTRTIARCGLNTAYDLPREGVTNPIVLDGVPRGVPDELPCGPAVRDTVTQ